MRSRPQRQRPSQRSRGCAPAPLVLRGPRNAACQGPRAAPRPRARRALRGLACPGRPALRSSTTQGLLPRTPRQPANRLALPGPALDTPSLSSRPPTASLPDAGDAGGRARPHAAGGGRDGGDRRGGHPGRPDQHGARRRPARWAEVTAARRTFARGARRGPRRATRVWRPAEALETAGRPLNRFLTVTSSSARSSARVSERRLIRCALASPRSGGADP